MQNSQDDPYSKLPLHPPYLGSCCGNSSTGKHHRWVGPVGLRLITVASNGFGDFSSVQSAIESAEEDNRENVLIQISAGCYIEKVIVPASKPYITLQEAGRDVTVIQWHDRANDRGPNGQQQRTYNSASVTVLANYFTARNISFKAVKELYEIAPARRWEKESRTNKIVFIGWNMDEKILKESFKACTLHPNVGLIG